MEFDSLLFRKIKKRNDERKGEEMADVNPEKLLEIRLDHWAHFFGVILPRSFGLGYPSISSGFSVYSSERRIKRGIGNVVEDPEAEEIEQWVKEMTGLGGLYPFCAICLRERYFGGRKVSTSKLSKKLSVSPSTFEKRVQQAKTFLLGRITPSESSSFANGTKIKVIYITEQHRERYREQIRERKQA
jgi:hypothetical protein